MADLATAQAVHLVGIGGSGMGALAMLLLEMGKQVSGSDVSADGPMLTRLREAGAAVAQGHRPENLPSIAEYVVRSSAVATDNPEVVEAERRGLPTCKLADAVGELMRGRPGVAVAGTHGKTTTTTLVSWLLDKAGLDPLALIGADTPAFPFGARLGQGPLVVEADEYDRRFLSYWPEVIVVTSVEPDHLDYYHDLAEIRAAFQTLVDRLPEHGRLVACADEPGAASLATAAQRETYGFAADAGWRIAEYAPLASGGSRFHLGVGGRSWVVEWSLVGEHNARNATAAIAVADYFGVGLRSSIAALAQFVGPRRRFETKGWPNGVWVVDDYGHHPTEVGATLEAARSSTRGSVWVVFQPHTTNRTASLLNEFGTAFQAADHALILPIYQPSGRETAPRAVTSADLVGRVQANGHPDARAVASFDEARALLRAQVRPGDLVMTMGAGDVTLLSDELVRDFGASA